MKHWLFCTLFALLLWTFPTAARAEVLPNEILRVQVVANSNEPDDQLLKLQVRDAVLPHMQELFAKAKDADDAYRLAQLHRSKWECAAYQVLSNSGSNQEAYAEIGEFHFQDRISNGIVMPSGTYRTLRITLGEGKGHNWWGVLYPDLCFFNRESEPITFYSSTVEFFKRLLGGDAV